MACLKPFKGQIKLVSGNQRKTILNFDIPEQETSFSDFLMCSHSKLKLTKEEKRELSLDHRRIIQQYLSLDPKTLLEYVEEFVNALPEDSQKSIKVCTQDFGSYICLAAISMGRIPKELKISFDLVDTPTELIPKKLSKTAQKNVSVNFIYSEDSWVTPFKSLYRAVA